MKTIDLPKKQKPNFDGIGSPASRDTYCLSSEERFEEEIDTMHKRNLAFFLDLKYCFYRFWNWRKDRRIVQKESTTDEETSAPVIMSTNNNSNAIDSAFADLAALAPTPPTIQDNSNTTTPVTSQLDNNNTSTTTTSNLSSTTLNETDVVQLESTLGQVQQTVQWYSEALNAYIEAIKNKIFNK